MLSTFDSVAEMMHVMNVKTCIMNAQTNRPIMSPTFDSTISSYLLTADSTKLNKNQFYQLLMSVTRNYDVKRLEEKGKEHGLITYDQDNQPLYSGKLLFSAILPEDFYYEFGEEGNHVLIKQGILVSGQLSSKTFGSGHNSIVQALYKAYPKDQPFALGEESEAAKFITDATFLMDQFIARRGFTVGIGDCVVPEAERANQEKIIMDAFVDAQRAAYKISKKVENPLEEEKREQQIKKYIDTVRTVGGKIAKILPSDNSLLAMFKSGAKGNELNVAQITTLLGQQFLKGGRFPLSITDNTRCLPYFPAETVDIRARGFCLNSFITGLTPAELFFSQASGRTGLMDTALKTADVGDMHRRMVKILEDIRIGYDGSVRNNNGTIFQFVYGEDGMDASELQFVRTPTGNVPMFVDVYKEARKLNDKYQNM